MKPEREEAGRARSTGAAEDGTGPILSGIPLGRLRDLAEDAAVVASAVDAGIFRALAERPDDAEGLAERLGLSRRGARVVLPALADLDLLVVEGDRYRPVDQARRTLADPSSREYAAGGLPLWLRNLRAFTRLPEALETGRPIDDPERDEEPDVESLARFMAAMDAAPRERVRRLVDLCLDRVPDARRALDLGGGPGHMSKEIARRGLDVVLFDRPDTVDFVGREYALRDMEKIRLVGGDFHEDPLPPGPFDLVLLSNVVHIYGPARNRALLRKVAGVTRSGGVCAIADFVRGVSPRAARFALVMLLRTEEGDTYREEECVRWLREAGFRDPELEGLDRDRQLLTAVRE